MRGAGTSIAGNAVGTGIVVDTTAPPQPGAVDSTRRPRTAAVEPGTVHATLQRAATGRTACASGPTPRRTPAAPIGGMIGNNACGSRALGYGRTSDNVVGLDVLTGRRAAGSSRRRAAPLHDRLDALVADHLATIRTDFGRFTRQVSGYSLEHLLPERGRDLARFLVGSEGTLAVVAGRHGPAGRATRRARALGGARLPDMFEAADAVPALLHHPLVACEGLDSRIVDVVARPAGACPTCRAARAGCSPRSPASTAERGAGRAPPRWPRDAGAVDALVVTEPARDGRAVADPGGRRRAGRPQPGPAGARRLGGRGGAAGAARRLPARVRRAAARGRARRRALRPLRRRLRARAHRLPARPAAAAPPTSGAFVEAAADLAAAHGGSLSGEHGDGRARSELLPRMYSPEVIDLFARGQAPLRPRQPAQPRRAGRPAPGRRRHPAGGPAARAAAPRCGWRTTTARCSRRVHRCTGVGKCVADNTGTGGVMCPSYLATRDEKDSTRGRARVLQEMVNGTLGHGRLEVRRGARGARPLPVLQGLLLGLPDGHRHGDVQGGGAAPALPPPAPAAQPLRAGPAAPLGPAGPAGRAAGQPGDAGRRRAAAGQGGRRDRPAPLGPRVRGRAAAPVGPRDVARAPRRPPPTTSCSGRTRSPTRFASDSGRAAVRVLEAAGLRVGVVGEHACCGLTWVSTGQLDRPPGGSSAHTLDVLHPYVAAGIPVVGLEPSCLATLRSDAVELTADPRAAEVAAGVRSLAEVLTGTPRLDAPRPDRHDGRGAAALPPRQRRRLGGRRRPAGPDRRHRHPGRGLLRAGRQLRRRAGPLRGVGRGGRARPAARPYAPRGRTRWCSPTGSPAAPSSTTSPGSARCTSPSCSRLPADGPVAPGG